MTFKRSSSDFGRRPIAYLMYFVISSTVLVSSSNISVEVSSRLLDRSSGSEKPISCVNACPQSKLNSRISGESERILLN